LTHIANKSISTGIFPERLKYSIVNPVYKKGDKTSPANYRPISLLTAFSKVLEKVLYNRLIGFLDNNNLLNPQQFRFRKKLSTDDAIYKLTHEILTALNNKEIVGSIFFYLSKAFDSVDHTVLTNKLPHYGITGKTKCLIGSYLTDRFQSAQLNHTSLELKTTSEWTKIKHGIPQGSSSDPFYLYYILMTFQNHYLVITFQYYSQTIQV